MEHMKWLVLLLCGVALVAAHGFAFHPHHNVNDPA